MVGRWWEAEQSETVGPGGTGARPARKSRLTEVDDVPLGSVYAAGRFGLHESFDFQRRAAERFAWVLDSGSEMTTHTRGASSAFSTSCVEVL